MPGTVLVVEDETYLAGLLSDVLQASGYNVVLTTAGRAADRVEEVWPEAIVMDYLMPGLNGAEVVAQVRARLGDRVPPVVLVTGLTNARELAEKIGADAYLRKPFDVDALVQVIDRLVDQANSSSNLGTRTGQ
jgi:DNA-binding response OmpR family regulator